ncbi:MAG: hypothetical protein AB1489_19515 [Acidobacteriota bacterium]
MKVKQLTDAELIAVLTDSQQSHKQLRAAWQEFIGRFEHVVIRTIHISFRCLAPQWKLTIEQVCEIAERMFSHLSQDRLRSLWQWGCWTETHIEIGIQKLAFETVLEYLCEVGERRKA